MSPTQNRKTQHPHLTRKNLEQHLQTAQHLQTPQETLDWITTTRESYLPLNNPEKEKTPAEEDLLQQIEHTHQQKTTTHQEHLHQTLDTIAQHLLTQQPTFQTLKKQEEQLQQIQQQATLLRNHSLEQRIHLYTQTLDDKKRKLRTQPLPTEHQQEAEKALQQLKKLQQTYVKTKWKPKKITQLTQLHLDTQRWTELLEHYDYHQQAEEARGFESVLQNHIIAMEQQRKNTRNARIAKFLLALTTIITILEGYDFIEKRMPNTQIPPQKTAQQQTQYNEQRTQQLLGEHEIQSLYIDKDQYTLSFLINTEHGWKTDHTFPITLGTNPHPKTKEGDKATPEGIYHITEIRTNPHPTFQPLRYLINYPNPNDTQQGKTGTGIIITSSHQPHYAQAIKERKNITNGGILLITEDIRHLQKKIEYRPTPVIIEHSDREL